MSAIACRSRCSARTSLTLIRPDLDAWAPGEHNGTFRRLNLAFVTATAALENWRSGDLQADVLVKEATVAERLESIVAERPELGAASRGRGLLHGLDLGPQGTAVAVARHAFEHGLVIETSGPGDRVLKLLPPLTISSEDVTTGLDRIEAALDPVAAPFEPLPATL